MSKKKKIIVAVVVVAVVIAGILGVVFFGGGGAASGGNGVYVQSINELMGGNTMGVQNKYMGVVESQETWDINLIEGQSVKEILVKVGDEVKIGDVLFEYDQDEMNLKLSQAKLEIEEIGNEIENYNSQINALNEEKANAPSDEQFNYTVQIQSIQISIRQAEYNRKSKQIELDKLQASVTSAGVTSKINGVVTGINENGETDNYGNPKPFMSVLTTGDYRVKGTINETNVWMLQVGSPVILRSRVDPDMTWTGTIDSIDTENQMQDNNNMYYMSESDSNMQSSKYPFYISLDSSEGLMMGQHLYIETDVGQDAPRDGVYIYSSYIVMEDTPYVWVDKGNGKLSKQTVELGEYNEEMDQYEVISGLEKTFYIAWPEEDLREGMKTTTVFTDDMLNVDGMDEEELEEMKTME